MSTPLAIGQLLLGTAELPGVSAIASAVAESAVQDRIPWSALDYSGQTITAISGSAIGGQVDTSQFYPTSNPSGFITGVDLSEYAKESSVSSKLDASASSSFYPSDNPSGFITGVDLSDYAKQSSLSSKLDSTASSSFYPADNPSGFITGVDLSDYAKESSLSAVSSVVSSIQEDVSSISGQISGLTGVYLEQSASSLFAPSGDYLSATDSSKFYPMTGNPSGFLQSGDLSDYAKESSVSSKLDASASSLFAPSGDYAFNSSLDEYVSNSSFTSYTSNIDSSITNMSSVVSGLTGVYLEQSASSLFAPSGDYAYNSSLSSYLLASDSSLFMPSGDYQTAGDYAYNSAVSGKLDTSASSEFYLTSNPSGFITGVDLSPYQLTADMSAYQLSGDYAYNSALSSKMDASASSDFLPASASGDLFTGVETDSTLTGNGLHSSVLGVNTINIAFASPLSTSEVANAIVVSLDSANYLAPSSLSAGPSGTVSSVNNSAFFDPRIQIVSASTLATGTDIVYIVTGNA